MFKKPIYSEVLCYQEYYVAGVDILKDSPCRTFIKNINLNLQVSTDYCFIKDAKLYKLKIGNKSCKFALAQIYEGIHVIAFFPLFNLNRFGKMNDAESREKNALHLKKISMDFVLKRDKDKNILYSKDRMQRYILTQKPDCVKAELQEFDMNMDAEIEFLNGKDLLLNNLGDYEFSLGVSIFDNMENAVKECKKRLK